MRNYNLVNIIFSALLVVFVLLYLQGYWNFWTIILLAFIYILLMLVVSTNISFDFFMKAHHRNPDIEQNAVALSFDDGPDENTLEILDILDRHQAKAAFFCIGKKVEQYPEIVKEIVKRGHIIGNHTYSHTRKIGFLPSSVIQKEIEEGDRVITEISGLKPNLFRPPFGIINPKTFLALRITGHEVIGWNRRPYDAVTSSEELILKRITRNLGKGDVILLHDPMKKTSAILEQLLVILKQRNLGVIRPDKLFKIDAYL